ncbi:hypothetical protein FE784_07215 [Paenibacillus hemerocallicola]|uniref:Uncharacterized protein n=1 Tax=Paenibacillus hemerocallicola TaxID=1172614 RepID=A0A5C4TD31_9BACL|nr:hypothetical protein [Paenibacillus hemerocallicola]TNJ66983.1 hypothetical protein FE784_07215 [Paenibacillus hemerocallicola]
MISLAGGANAAPNETGAALEREKDFTLEVHSLREGHRSKLYIAVEPANDRVTAPSVLKKVQVKLFGKDGQLQTVTNYNDVPAPGGKAFIELGDIPLPTGVHVQVLVQTAQSVSTGVLEGETAVTEFAVKPDETAVSDFQGYGNQFNMHLYTALNDPARGFTGNEPPKEAANVEAKVKALKPGLSRIFLSPVNFDPGNENRMGSFIKTVELAQQAGAIVNVTWWFIERAPGDDPVKQKVLKADREEKGDGHDAANGQTESDSHYDGSAAGGHDTGSRL